MIQSSDSLISIVVPIYGGEQYLEQCIDSILTQSHKNLEAILVNDGSPDRSGAICDHASRTDSRIQVIHQPNSGLVSARKAGVSIATGKYLGFVDGDDWIGPEFIETMYELIEVNRADLVISGHVRDILGKQEVVRPLIDAGTYTQSDIQDVILPKAIFNGNFFQHGVSTYVWNKLFKRELASQFIREIPTDIVVGEDSALTYPYLGSASRLVVTHDAQYFYRQRPRSILKSVQDANTEFNQLSNLFQYLVNFFNGKQFGTNFFDQIMNYFYALALIRTGGIVSTPGTREFYSPFPGLSPNKRIVVYSSGSFGQHFTGAVKRLGFFELVGWIDEDADESQRQGLPVTKLESINSFDFDLVVIASLDQEYSESIALKLENLGVTRSKISTIAPDFGKLESFMIDIGFDLETFSYAPRIRDLEEPG